MLAINADSPLWFDDPQRPNDAEKDAKEAVNVRAIVGDWLILAQQFNYLVFPQPEVRAKMKAAGKKVLPIRIEQYHIHMLDSRSNAVVRLKVYRHQGRYLYLDMGDVGCGTSIKTPSKARAALVERIAQLLRQPVDEASRLLASWTCGN